MNRQFVEQFDQSVRGMAEAVVRNEQAIAEFYVEFARDLQREFGVTAESALELARGLCDRLVLTAREVSVKAYGGPGAPPDRSGLLQLLRSGKEALWPLVRQQAVLHRSRVAARR